ncbi:MAG: Hint domain-containing protein [bacterium]
MKHRISSIFKFLFIVTLFIPLFFSVNKVYARGGCFEGNTLISTPDGDKKISDLKEGDKIISYNFEKNIKEISTISQIDVLLSPDYYIINNQTKVTATHPFYVHRGDETIIVEVQNLKSGDILIGNNQQDIVISTIQHIQEDLQVYNLINVTPNNNFYANGMLVHNKGGGCFIGTTQISTPEGKKNISDLKSGDTVISFDLEKNNYINSKIGSIDIYEVNDILLINNIEVTSTHPFYVYQEGVLVIKTASELSVGDILFNEDRKNTVINNIENKSGKFTVYNLLNVTPNNNYFANDVLVHNKGGGGGGSSGGSSSSTPRTYYYNGTNYTDCNKIADLTERQKCVKKMSEFDWAPAVIYGGAFGGMGLWYGIKALTRKKNGIQRVKMSGLFSRDQIMINHVTSAVPFFKNEYGKNYYIDNQVWNLKVIKNPADVSLYGYAISNQELVNVTTQMFIRYQNDWTYKNFIGMKEYIMEPLASTQAIIHRDSFGSDTDFVYNPQVIETQPVSVVDKGSYLLIKMQINASMVNFEISDDGYVLCGMDEPRKFTEYWTLNIDKATKRTMLNKITQS